ncbi:hypothetical protein FSP39_002036 [Pinctada imbricata]|uniref:Uncharacterized protein n=1 Tax=Pinctada imbricata TaxID=66713 RepID=A0AA88YJI7_PINIB|nr:hypothetical protein FSP39_002036 [Pinctada imbricata]
MIRGTQGIDNQIATGVSFVQKIPELKQKCISPEQKDLGQLCFSIESPHILKRGISVSENAFVLGAIKEKGLTDEEFDCLWEYLGYCPVSRHFKYFAGLEIKGHVIYGMDYGRMIKRDNSSIFFDHHGEVQFGKVRFFVILDFERKEDTTLALTECFRCPRYSPEINILSVKVTNEIKFVNIKYIKEGCMYLSVDNTSRKYVCRFPNKLESD